MSSTRRSPVASRIRRVLGWSSLGLLVAFHAVLLWERLIDATLFEPVPALRWLATVALLGALVRLHRQGVSLFKGRGATVVWLLVLLLHASFWGPLADPAATCDGWAGPGLILALPALTIILGAVSPALRRFLARAFGTDGLSGHPDSTGWVADRPLFLLTTGSLPVLACRPPPAL